MYRLPRSEPARLTPSPVSNMYYVIHNPDPVVVHRIDRKALKLVKVRYAAFKQFLDSYIALCQEVMTIPYGGGTRPVLRYDRAAYEEAFGDFNPTNLLGTLSALTLSDDPAAHFKAVLLICQQFAPRWRLVDVNINVSDVVKYYNDAVIRIHRDEVFREALAAPGQMTKDRWAHIF